MFIARARDESSLKAIITKELGAEYVNVREKQLEISVHSTS